MPVRASSHSTSLAVALAHGALPVDEAAAPVAAATAARAGQGAVVAHVALGAAAHAARPVGAHRALAVAGALARPGALDGAVVSGVAVAAGARRGAGGCVGEGRARERQTAPRENARARRGLREG